MRPRRPAGAQPIGWRSAALATIVCVLRGGNQVAIKFALTLFPPLWSAFARMAVSLLAISAWAALSRRALWPKRTERWALIALGAAFAIQISMLHIGADLTSPAYAVILINTNPIFANLMAHFVVVEDRLTLRRIAGLALAFAGVCGVFFGRPDETLASRPLAGNLLVMCSAALVAGRTVYIQRLVQRMEPAKAMFWQIAVSLPLFAGGGWMLGERELRGPWAAAPLTAILYQGVIVGGAALVIWVLLLKKHTPGSVSVFSFATPLAGVFLSGLLFRERLTARLFAGLGAVLGGVWLATKQPAARPNRLRSEARDIG